MFSLLEKPRKLIKAALGEIKADLVIKKTKLVNVVTAEVLEDIDIVVYDGHIVRVDKIKDLEKYIGSKTLVIDGKKYYTLPGFIETHVHIESSMLNVREFGKLAAMHGVTTVVADPHEIGNVLGVDGIKMFIEESRYTPVRFFFQVPSCVPAVDPSYNIDSGGQRIDSGQVAVLMQDPGIIGLGEVMDIVSVWDARSEVLVKIAAAKLLHKIVDGHAPLVRGEKLDAYIVAGISSDHESTFVDEALEKLRKGMYVFIREGSAWKNLKELSKIVTEYKLDTRRLTLAADDISVEDLVEKGYLDHIVNLAIEYGIDPIKAIQMVTINAAEHLRLDDKIGIIAPGRYADMILVPSIEKISVVKTIIDGKVVYDNGKWLYKPNGEYIYPEKARKTMNLKKIPEPHELLIKTETDKGVARIHLIEAIPGSSLTEWRQAEVPIEKGYLKAVPEEDILHIAVLDRHHASGNIGKGFVKGLGLREGAIAQTIAHDTHNLIVAGTNPNDMAKAIRRVVEVGGGIAVSVKGKIKATVKLPIAGLVSDSEYKIVYKELKDLEKTLKKLGVDFSNIHMTLALLALPVIPKLRITDKGLVDVFNAKIIDPVIEVSVAKK